MNYRMIVPLLASMAAILTGACGGSTDPVVNAHIRFVTDAPFCTSPFPVNFFIDDAQVGRDTMWFGDGATGSIGFQRFKSYRSFSVQVGSHKVRATLLDTIRPIPPYPTYIQIYDWPDTSINVGVGAEVVRKLPFYCS